MGQNDVDRPPHQHPQHITRIDPHRSWSARVTPSSLAQSAFVDRSGHLETSPDRSSVSFTVVNCIVLIFPRNELSLSAMVYWTSLQRSTVCKGFNVFLALARAHIEVLLISFGKCFRTYVCKFAFSSKGLQHAPFRPQVRDASSFAGEIATAWNPSRNKLVPNH